MGLKKIQSIKIVYRGGMLLAFLFCASGAWATTSNDYYEAGLKLYNMKNFDKAILYFGAAIKLDPQNVAAYEGRGNCYYTQGDYSDALENYEQVQKLSPSPQIDQFVNQIQSKLGSSASSSETGVSGSYLKLFEDGKMEFNQKKYFAAAQTFEKALEFNHKDFDLYYYLGLTYKLLGDLKNAVVALGIANQIKPTPQIAGYVRELRSKLSPDDRDWADEQLSDYASGMKIDLHTHPPGETDYAFRLEPAVMFPHLVDFQNEANNGETYATEQGGASYNGSIPNLSANIGFEPAVNLTKDIEMGFLIASIPVGTFSEQYTQGANTTSNTYDITGYVLGLNFRLLLGDGPIKFFIAAGPLLTPISITYTSTVNLVPTTGTFASWGLGGQGQIGLDIHLSTNIAFGPFVSFQAISDNSFSGTVINNSNNINSTGTLYTLPNGQWPSIRPVLAGEGIPHGAVPTTVDLSGIVPGVQLSLFF